MRSLDQARVVTRAFRAVTEEFDVELHSLSGQLPRELNGVLYRNGPGTLVAGETRYQHPFDGDGMVTRFEFRDGTCRYRNRYVTTRERSRELAAGRMLYRAFGTNLPGGLRANFFRTRFKNAANTHVVPHGGRLYALWEGGVPHTLDPQTLGTLHRFTFDGKLENRTLEGRLFAPELPFSAHPKVDPVSGELFNFGTLLGHPPKLLIYRVDAEGHLGPIRVETTDTMAFVHDFILTGRYLVFVWSPVHFRIARSLAGWCPPAEAISAGDGDTELVVVPREGGPVRRFKARPCFAFHHIGGWDTDDGLVLYTLRMDSYPARTADVTDPVGLSEVEYPSPLPTEMTVHFSRDEVAERVVSESACELPRSHPASTTRPHRYAWATSAARPGSPFFTRLVRLDLEGGSELSVDLAPDLPGEPVFVPADPSLPVRDGEETGWILSVVYVAETQLSELQVWSADLKERVARLPLPHSIPPSFHGSWVPG